VEQAFLLKVDTAVTMVTPHRGKSLKKFEVALPLVECCQQITIWKGAQSQKSNKSSGY